MTAEGRARALRYVMGLIEGYERNLRWARRSENRPKEIWLESCVKRLRGELGVMQGDSPEGLQLCGRWAFLTEGL